MNNNLTIMFIIFLAFVIGCPGSPLHLSMMSPDELKTAHPRNLCNAYYVNRTEKIKEELKRRNLLTERESGLIEQNKISVGMSELALICSWGGTKVNESVGSYGVHKQYVYRPCDRCSASYVYVENGKVSSWQK